MKASLSIHMTSILLALLPGSTLMVIAEPIHPADDARRLPEMRISAPWLDSPFALNPTIPAWQASLKPDASDAFSRLPGAAISRNGPVTGQLQLRGVTADRVGIRVGGMSITPACPNHMDPPLHYALLAPDSRIVLFPGCAPVSQGGDRIGGTLTVDPAMPEFSNTSKASHHGWISSGFSGDRDASTLRTSMTSANDACALRYLGDAASAGNLRYPGGHVSASGYDLTRHQLLGSIKTAGGFWEIGGGFGFTRDAGTPALPMDMIRDDSWNLSVRQQETLSWGRWSQSFHAHDIDHLMDNHSLRPVIPGTMKMDAPATSSDLGYLASAAFQHLGNTWDLGVDLHRAEFDAAQVVTTSGAWRDTFQNNRRNRTGAYADCQRELRPSLASRLGIRADVVSSNADPVSNQISPTPAVTADLNAFNATDRTKTDWLPSAMASLAFTPNSQDTLATGLALTSRAPSFVERYLWTPSNASAGLADGRSYLGSPGLDPETAIEASFTARHETDTWFASLSPFYRVVDDYIIGLPHATRIDSSGLPVLTYSNINQADFYGLECSYGTELPWNFALSSHLSQVTARNRDQGGHLYRIAPLRGLVDLSWQGDRWECHLECQWANAQNEVSTLQNESPTPGYAVWNLRISREMFETVRVETGVENLLNHRYCDHLGGINRVGGGDLRSGEKIPSAARFAYLMLGWSF